MTLVLPLSPVLLHLGPQLWCLYLCFRCLAIFWQCQNCGQGAAILDFKMAAICFTLLCTSLHIALRKENNDSLYLEKWLLCDNCHHMAAISKSKMAALLLDMQFSKRDRCRLPSQSSLRKFLYLHFVLVQMAAIFNFTMTAALPVLFSVVEHTNRLYLSTYHSSRRLLA